ncbi:MAG: DUF1236 domain-containing protein [Xanthobacteraceae bacterium]
MRKFLLASAAVTALVAGPAIANAQGTQKSQDTPAASSQQQAPKGGARDTDTKRGPDMDTKRSPSAQSGERRDSTGSSSQSSPMNDRASKSGPSGEGKSAGSERENKGMSSQRDDKANAQKSGQADRNRETTGASQDAQDQGKSNAQKSGTSEMKKNGAGPSQGAQGRQSKDQKAGSQPTSSTPSDQRSTTGQSPADQRPTTGQSQTDQRMKGDRANRDNQPAGRQGATQTDQRTGTSGTVNQRDQAGSTQSSTSGTTQVTQEQQTKFNQVIEKQKVQSVTNVNFSVSVGSTVPSSVRFHDVPRDIVTINPEFRGKKFVVVRDEIVIVEPRTHKIVSVIPRSARGTTGTATSTRQTTSSKLNLAPEKRRVIRETVIKEQAAPRCADLQISVGAEVPRSLQLRPLPDVVVTEVPEIRSYDFCIKGDDVVLIDPSDYRIVEVID